MKKFAFVFVILLLSCSAPKPVYDYDTATNFSQYKTYSYFEDAGNGLSGLDKKRFESEISRHLDSVGFSFSKTPDFFVNFISSIQLQPNNQSVGMGLGAGQGGVSISTDVIFGKPDDKELILIDFVDEKSNELFWQGKLLVKLDRERTPEERLKLVRAAVLKILENYPPK